jgi:hypothetical protein
VTANRAWFPVSTVGVAATQGFGDRPPTPLPSTWLAERGATPYPPTLNPLLLPYPTPRVSRTQGAFSWYEEASYTPRAVHQLRRARRARSSCASHHPARPRARPLSRAPTADCAWPNTHLQQLSERTISSLGCAAISFPCDLRPCQRLLEGS